MSERVSVKEAADFLGISVPTLRRRIRECRVPFYRLGRRIVFDTDELTAILQAARVAPRSENGPAWLWSPFSDLTDAAMCVIH